jgi:hypothetical protein
MRVRPANTLNCHPVSLYPNVKTWLTAVISFALIMYLLSPSDFPSTREYLYTMVYNMNLPLINHFPVISITLCEILTINKLRVLLLGLGYSIPFESDARNDKSLTTAAQPSIVNLSVCLFCLFIFLNSHKLHSRVLRVELNESVLNKISEGTNSGISVGQKTFRQVLPS